MTNHHKSSKKQKTRNNNSWSDRDDRSFDHSLIGESLNLGHKNVAQIAFALSNGTQEVKDLLLNECNIIYECRECLNMFRSFANLVAHKRIYCKGHQCEQMVLYDQAWFVPEQEKKVEEKVEVASEEPIRNPTITFPQLNSKTLELKHKSLNSLANSLRKDSQRDDSGTMAISTLQFYSNATQSQRLTRQSLNKQTSLALTSIEESTLKTETSSQKSSEKINLFTKSSSDNFIDSSILKKSSPMTNDHNEISLNESLLPFNEDSSSKAPSLTPTPIVCKKNKQNKPNRKSLLKRESPNANIQTIPQFFEMKPPSLKGVKPVWSGSGRLRNAYGTLLNRHYHNDQSILSKESLSSAAVSSTSSSSILNNLNGMECSERVCKSDISNDYIQCDDVHERPIKKLCIPVEVITIDSDNDDTYSNEIYAL